MAENNNQNNNNEQSAANDNGALVADTDKNWLSIDGNVVAYYHTDTIENGDDY